MPEPRRVTAAWLHQGMAFAEEQVSRAPMTIDGDAALGPSPVDTLLLAVAGCTGSDIVEIVRKKRIDLRELRVEVAGERREQYPRRYVKIALVYHVTAPGATEQAIRQAIDLSLEKYCSVSHSLNPDIPITYELRLQA